MPVLSKELRNKLEKAIVEARDVAEAGARVALESLAVHHYEPYPHMDTEQRELRNRLRARGRQLGDQQEPGGRLEIRHLVRECGYEHWHRMLFARFLAENNLLIEPEIGVAITMAECEELAGEAGEDPYAMAARFAQTSLPQIFREGDPVLELKLPPETQQTLDRLLGTLPAEVFIADDSLGWTYQFWQSKRKEEVKASGNKIGADELPAVTQLFTEHYMVQFLYHNTIGAWHAGKVLAANPSLAETAKSEQELRDAVHLKSLGGYNFDYLRFVREQGGGQLERRAKPGDAPVPERSDETSEEPTGPWRPAAGTFDGWPKMAKEIKVLDPCCGSGHFLNEGLQILVRLRMDEEGLDLKEAIEAVLSDNLHGLEIDPRCAQIAAFNLALAAWKMVGKPIELPPMHIACSGLAVGATRGKWISLAGDDPRLRAGMGRLYDLFEQAPVLGSLIDPKVLKGDMFEADFSELQPLLQKALEHEREDDEKLERAVAAQGMAKAAELLSGEYTLAVTNVPYLGQRDQGDAIRQFCLERYKDSKADLGTVFLERCVGLLSTNGTQSLVTPQNWLFLKNAQLLRVKLLKQQTWNLVARLGEHAFQSNAAAGAFAAMVVISKGNASKDQEVACIDVSAPRGQKAVYAMEKASLLRYQAGSTAGLSRNRGTIAVLRQSENLSRVDAIIGLEPLSNLRPLSEFAYSYQGASTIDVQRFRLHSWEVSMSSCWEYHMSTPGKDRVFSGYCYVSASRKEGSAMHEIAQHLKAAGYLGGWLSGNSAWGKQGIACSWMNDLPATPYYGAIYDNMVAVIIPNDPALLGPIWAYCSSPSFNTNVRKINQKVQVANSTLVKIPFDVAHWKQVAAEKYPNGLPEPYSDDPTQWLFHGHPCGSVIWDEEKKWTAHGPLRVDATVLQVTVARLLGYRWPAELDPEMRLADEQREWVARCDELLQYADEDGIVCIPSIRGESPAADRVRSLLAAAFGEEWTPEKERQLIEATGSKAMDLDTWLRNDFFEQHCKLFHNRPFVWHIWDGRKRDGFHALVNYHELAEGNGGGRRTLENLTYSYLGDWISRQEDGVRRGVGGAEDRLAAALELKARLVAILEGEPPFDLFIRWKSLAEQPIGWDPDINDGVRLNARPFMASDLPNGKKGAGIFRWKPNITWKKDRGKEPISLRPKSDFPWFYGWDEQTLDFLGNDKFDGNRWNNLHYTNAAKQAARDALKEDDS